jgi:alkylation response protein AidB-like acyl-CoA dehydrogenase
MNYELSQEQADFKKRFREFCDREIAPRAAEIESSFSILRENCRRLAEGGFFGFLFPEKYGDHPRSYGTSILAWEEMARSCPSTFLSCVLGSMLTAVSIHRYGKEDQKERHLPPLIGGDKFGAFALTEAQAGSDLAGLKTSAVKKEINYVLNGVKAFALNGPIADVALVFALTDPESPLDRKMSAFLAAKGAAGFSAGPPLEKLGARGAPVSDLCFENCRVPPDGLLGAKGQGFEIATQMKEISRLGYAAYSLGIAQACLEEAVQYARTRQAFGRPIAHFQEISFKVADMQMYVDTGRLLLYHAAWRLDEEMEAGTEIAIAKLFLSEAAAWCASTAVQIHGGQGFLKGNRVERLYRDVKLGEIGEGTSEMQRRMIAGSLLGEGY